MTKVIDTVSEVLDDVLGNRRGVRKETDARVTEILGQVGDGVVDADGAWLQIVHVLRATYTLSAWEDCREAAAGILNAVGVPYELSEF